MRPQAQQPPPTPPPLPAPPKPSLAEQMRQLTAAAEGGDPQAQFDLGFAYATGAGVTRNDAVALQWFKRAADQKLAGAQFYLGTAYADGRGVPKDAHEAAGWFRKAADQGFAEAQLSLSNVLASDTTSKDLVEAYMWAQIATLRTTGPAQRRYSEARSALAKQMPKDQISAAEKRAADWIAAFDHRK